MKWANLIEKFQALDGVWVFRGDTSPCLKTGLELALAAWSPRLDPVQTERNLLLDFQRRYPAWSNQAPSSKDTLAWLALMQHYGAPTRLLDCTYSPYIAMYFALQKLLMSEKQESYVWAFRSEWFTEQAQEHLPGHQEYELLKLVAEKHDGEAFEKLFLRDEPIKFVYPVNPLSLNERLVKQQGVFLCPADIKMSFEQNINNPNEATNTNNVFRVTLPRNFLHDGLLQLLRMNIDSATLFPGLPGYAKSLITRMALFMGD